jgi:hypothetical protein
MYALVTFVHQYTVHSKRKHYLFFLGKNGVLHHIPKWVLLAQCISIQDRWRYPVATRSSDCVCSDKKSKCLGWLLAISRCTSSAVGVVEVPKQVFHQAMSF